MDNRIKKIADHFGYETQSRLLFEEMSELTKAINKEWRSANGFLPDANYGVLIDNIAEEVADTEIMLDQIKHLLKIEGDAGDWRERKLERTIEKIEPEKMVQVIGGVHGIHYSKDYEKYYFKVDCEETFKPGDLAIVHDLNGDIERVLVLEVKEVPESKAAKYEKAVARVVFKDEQ